MIINALVVDDSPVMRKLVIRAVNATEYKPASIIEAGDGVEGLAKYKETEGINLILSDWNMPNMDGLTFVKEIRKLSKDVIIIMITTEGTMGKMESALGEGANNYVVKPFKPDDLQRKLFKEFGKV